MNVSIAFRGQSFRLHLRQGRLPGPDERPVRLVLRPLGDPPLQDVLLLVRERLLDVRRRHQLALVLREDPMHQLALVRLSRDDGQAARLQRTDGLVPEVQPEPRLAGLVVRAVAREAATRQDRPDLAREQVLRARAFATSAAWRADVPTRSRAVSTAVRIIPPTAKTSGIGDGEGDPGPGRPPSRGPIREAHVGCRSGIVSMRKAAGWIRRFRWARRGSLSCARPALVHLMISARSPRGKRRNVRGEGTTASHLAGTGVGGRGGSEVGQRWVKTGSAGSSWRTSHHILTDRQILSYSSCILPIHARHELATDEVCTPPIKAIPSTHFP